MMRWPVPDGVVRVGVIGLGHMGRQHLRVYRDLDEVEVVAVADPDPTALAQAQRHHPAHAYRDYRQLLDAEALDAVSIVVPTREHRCVAIDALERGIHVLVEKPIAMTSDEALEMIARA